MSQFRGSANSNKIAVLEEGIKYTPISILPEQSQFLEFVKYTLDPRLVRWEQSIQRTPFSADKNRLRLFNSPPPQSWGVRGFLFLLHNSLMNIFQRIFTDHYEEIKYTFHPRQTEIENIDKIINCGDPSFGGAMYSYPRVCESFSVNSY